MLALAGNEVSVTLAGDRLVLVRLAKFTVAPVFRWRLIATFLTDKILLRQKARCGYNCTAIDRQIGTEVLGLFAQNGSSRLWRFV